MEKEKPTEENPPAVPEKKSTEDETETGEFRVYEASYLLLPSITEEALPKETAQVKEHISFSGGAIFSEEDPKPIKLAYPMFKVVANKNTKFENAYFGWIKFEGEAENISKVKKSLENNENILRFLILKTTKESAVARKPFPFVVKSVKPIFSATKDEPKLKTPEAPQEINEAELDKTIEALVID